MRFDKRLQFSLMAAALSVAAIGLASCGETEEDTSQVATQAPSAAATTSPTAATTPTLTATTPAPSSSSPPASTTPDDWLSYTDPSLGFTLRYPPDLVAKDLTPGAAPGSQYVRVVDFRPPKESSRGFSVAVLLNSDGLPLDQWVLEFAACLPGTDENGTMAGTTAVFCTSEPEEIPEEVVVLQSTDKIFYISSILPPSEFALVAASLRL